MTAAAAAAAAREEPGFVEEKGRLGALLCLRAKLTKMTPQTKELTDGSLGGGATPTEEEGESPWNDGGRSCSWNDVVVIGSGLGGLCCAGLLARYAQDVVVLESHDRPGGAAHSFDVKGFHFDFGPSLFSGFQSRGPQANPLAQVLDALGESVPCASYGSWMVHVPEGQFESRIGPTDFLKVQLLCLYPNVLVIILIFLQDLETYVGLDATREWQKLLYQKQLQDAVIPISATAMALPPLSIRGDLGILSTAAGRYAPSLLQSLIKMGPRGALGATKLLRPFSEIVDSLELKNPFVRNWIDLLCFLLAGVKSESALSAEMPHLAAGSCSWNGDMRCDD
ncbi:uncharacterized protein LOC123396554 [Hordeum vulgare subsp. vulgare]|uniref:uncharacterized protein LOC123396554 n=1 Tax=Hordeum vulgare subsp. vulgare TaxID=112509 RepID=UPI001D1A496B|nr:uncharacterized protein LOC123396554 [Hordeum vulgare subsp. vulgare]